MTEFFKHDWHARNDPKLTLLLSRYGFAGIGVYWSVIEIMHEQSGCIARALLNEFVGIANRMYHNTAKVDDFCAIIDSMVQLNLIQQDDEGVVTCERVSRNLVEYKERSNMARKAAQARWDANAMRTHSERNADAMPEEEEKKKNEKKKKSAGIAFAMPSTPSECYEYGEHIGLPNQDVDAWFDYHEARGWKGMKHTERSVKASLRTWGRNRAKFGASPEPNIPTQEELEAYIRSKWPNRSDDTNPEILYALDFFRHYSAQGWYLPNKLPIVNWKAKAYEWVLKSRQENQ